LPIEFALKVADKLRFFLRGRRHASPNTASSTGFARGSSDPDAHHFTCYRVKRRLPVANDAMKFVAPNPPGIADVAEEEVVRRQLHNFRRRALAAHFTAAVSIRPARFCDQCSADHAKWLRKLLCLAIELLSPEIATGSQKA
jgi:hypothetical protein